MNFIKFLKLPILDREKKQFGQRIKLENDKEITQDELSSFIENIQQKKYTFINLSKDILENETILSLLNHENTVLITEAEVNNFKTAAYIDYPQEAVEKADFIFIRNIDELEKAVKFKGQIIYENIKTEEEFESLKNKNEISYFEGFFFAKVKEIKNEKIKSSKLDLINLFNLVMEDFDTKKIEDALKRNPDLSLHLLRYVNSAAFSFRSKITSLKHAVSILGQKQFLNWILLQMYYSEDSSKNYLLETAAIRAKMMEFLSEKIGEDKEKGFLVGVLSLSNVLLEVDIKDILSQINVTEDIKRSLLERNTNIGKLLDIIEKLEEEDLITVEKRSNELGINISDIMEAQLKAIAWYNQLQLS